MSTRQAFWLGATVGVLVQPAAFFSFILVDRLTGRRRK